MLDSLLHKIPVLEQYIRGAYDSHGTDIIITKSPYYGERRKRQVSREQNDLLDPTQEIWTFEQGDYSSDDESILPLDALNTLRRETPLLSGDELFIAHQIKTLLSTNKTNDKVRALDAGGMYGLSWVKIAKYFESEINQGPLEMVVTNFHFDPKKGSNTKINRFGEKEKLMLEEDYLKWEENHNLIKYINCNPELMPNNIDILYEKHSITFHSETPAVSRLTLLSKLRSGGTFITGDEVCTKESDNYTYNTIDSDDIHSFNLAIKKSKQFKSDQSLIIKDVDYPLQAGWHIITKLV